MPEQPERKKRRQNVACDSCRLRRVKCDMLALLTPTDGSPERPLHVLVRENPEVSCTNCVSKGIRCTTNQIVNPAKPNKGRKRIEEAKKMFGSDGFQHSVSPPAPAPPRLQHHSRRASVSRSPGVSTAGGSSAVSEQSTPGMSLHTFSAHQFNVLGSSTGHSGPTASFVPPAPIPSPTIHPAAHGWSAPLEDWSGIAFEAHNFGFPHPLQSSPFATEAAPWEAAIVVPPVPPMHAHSLPAPPSALNRIAPPQLEAPVHSLSDPVLPSGSITPLTASTVSFLPHQPLASSPGVTSDTCLPSHPSSRSDSSNSNPQPRVTGRKRTLPDNEDDDVLELVRHVEPVQYDPCYLWAPRDKSLTSPVADQKWWQPAFGAPSPLRPAAPGKPAAAAGGTNSANEKPKEKPKDVGPKTVAQKLKARTLAGKEAEVTAAVSGELAKGPPPGRYLGILSIDSGHNQAFDGSQLGPGEEVTKFVVHNKNTARILFRPRTVRPKIDVLSAEERSLEISLSVKGWQVSAVYPQTTLRDDNGRTFMRWFLRVKAKGVVEDLLTSTETNGVFYELVPDEAPKPKTTDPNGPLVPAWPELSPITGFCIPSAAFVPHIDRVMDTLGLPPDTRTNMITSWLPGISRHKNIAYRILNANQLESSSSLYIIPRPDVFLRIFIIFKGIPDSELGDWKGRSVTEAEMGYDWIDTLGWRQHVGYSNAMQDEKLFRVIEYSSMEVFDTNI